MTLRERLRRLFTAPTPKWIVVKFPSVCQQCGERVEEGASAYWTPRHGVTCKPCMDDVVT